MNRRIAIQRIAAVLGAAVSASTASALMAGCRAPADPAAYVPRIMSPDTYTFVGDLSDTIIPVTDTPGASAAGVPAFIDSMLADFYPADESGALAGAIRSLADRLAGQGFSTEAERTNAVGALDSAAFSTAVPPRQQGEFFSELACYRRLKELVVSGYYTSEVGSTEELRMNPMGPFRGDVPMSEIERAWA